MLKKAAASDRKTVNQSGWLKKSTIELRVQWQIQILLLIPEEPTWLFISEFFLGGAIAINTCLLAFTLFDRFFSGYLLDLALRSRKNVNSESNPRDRRHSWLKEGLRVIQENDHPVAIGCLGEFQDIMDGLFVAALLIGWSPLVKISLTEH